MKWNEIGSRTRLCRCCNPLVCDSTTPSKLSRDWDWDVELGLHMAGILLRGQKVFTLAFREPNDLATDR